MNTEQEFEEVSVAIDKLSLAFTCRTCLNTDSDQQLIAIFEDTKGSGKLSINLFNQLLFLKLKIAKDDGFPANICSICMERLVAFDTFRKRCEKAQKYLEQYFVKLPEDEPEIKPDVFVYFVEDSVHLSDSLDLKPPDDSGNEVQLDIKAESEKSSKLKAESGDSSSEYKPESDEASSEEEETAGADDTENSKTNDDKLKCPVCEKIFRTVAIKNDHLYLHSDVKGYSCNECDKSCKTRRYLRKHKAVHAFSDHECATCGMKFTKTSKYQYHLESHNRTKKPRKVYRCSHCDKLFDRHYRWKYHELTHTGKRSYLCNICGKSFHHDSSLTSHLKTHDEKEEKYICDICNKEFARKYSLKAHLNIHLNVRAYQCDQCGMKFVQQSTLKGHMKLHTADKTHQCEFCLESFLRIRELRRHRLIVHNKTAASVCIQQSLQEHNEIVENVSVKEKGNPSKKRRKKPTECKPYSCDLCNKSFKIPSALENHVKIHSEDRQFICKECGDAFRNIVHLQNHINEVHMKLKPYSCEVCKKSFTRAGDRNRHRQKHSTDKPHQCSICEKSFAWARTLKVHIRDHTGEKPYVCNICNASFSRCDYLARHTRNAHIEVQMKLKKEQQQMQAVLS